MFKLVLILFFIVSSPAFAGEECADERAIWSQKANEGKIIYYQSKADGAEVSGRFEYWQNSAMKWRVNSKIFCSNGVSFCSLSIALDNGNTIDVGYTAIYDGANHAKFLVFDHLKQSMYRSQVFENGRVQVISDANSVNSNAQNPILLPNIFKFDTCKAR